MTSKVLPTNTLCLWLLASELIWTLFLGGETVTVSPPTVNSQFLDISYKRSATPPSLLAHNNYVRYNVGVLLVSNTGASFDLEKCAPAVDLALEYVNEVYMSPHGIILDKVQSSYPTCDDSLTGGKAADMKFLSNVIAFIGPSCGFALSPVARLGSYWDIPVVTGLGDQPPSTESEISGDRLLGHRIDANNSKGVFGDKSKFSTLTRLSYCQCRLKLVFDSICKKYNWKHLAVLYDQTDLFSFIVGRTVINGMKEFGYEVYGHGIDGRVLAEMDNAILEMRAHARIVILSFQENLVREFIIKAYRSGLTNGDWAFLDIELFKNKPSETNFWQTGNDESDYEAKLAYESLLTISLLIPKSPLWRNFTDQVKLLAFQDYNYTFPPDEEVSFFVGAFYDGVILLGKAFNETLSKNASLTDGKAIALQMWNRTFQGVTGNVDIDENGDRNADYAILDMNPVTGHFETVAIYSAKKGLTKLTEIRWPNGGGPPPDIPPCGFLNTDPNCAQGTGVVASLASIIIIFLLIAAGVVLYVYRHMRDVEAASSTRWRILPEELLFETGEHKSRTTCEEKDSSRGSLSLGTGTGGTTATFAPTAFYKGTQVAVRKIILSKRIEFTKQIISEIRQAKDIQHENISRLIGLCLSSSDSKSTSEKWDQILVLTEYCSRGSLRDVILNVHIHLDWPFRLSLISDIVNGMAYLQSFQITHGHLTSMKCLVDARFVVKINDFGLNTIYACRKEDRQEMDYFVKKFWTAPEHLSRSRSSSGSSLKGDVFSFGIILYEVKTRSIPYASVLHNPINALTPEEVINRVESSRIPPFRPQMGDDEYPCPGITSLIQQCWAENPDERPDFVTIKQTLKKLMKGAGTLNLVDDLLRRLEQHATHLESLVDDKTRELAQEKRRSEDLLFQLLPRQVADQLLRGETVIPESFDAVTIYFSDVVGFTSICAKSSPIQVVDFLNQLYGCFDGILDAYDVYKVETIGDAYLVVSGCPTRNGDKHVTEIACLAFSILDAVKNFTIAHLPEEQLKIRIGIHTGSVCAGCVGHRMPRYCLFGDTVNTASRMESSGLPLKIHISEATATALREVGGFDIVRRGEVVLKGKGTTVTYWLEGCDDENIWRRTTMGHSTSRDSLETKTSVHVFSGSPSVGCGGFSGGIGLFKGISSAVSPIQHHHFSPSNNVTTISITPAD